MKNKLKINNGITLIALVITIIVLLILAGITIVTLTGDNGILNKAQSAGDKTNISKERELIELAIINSRINDNKNLKIDKKILRQELLKIDGLTGIPESEEEAENQEWKIIGKNETLYIIGENGLKMDNEDNLDNKIQESPADYFTYSDQNEDVIIVGLSDKGEDAYNLDKEDIINLTIPKVNSDNKKIVGINNAFSGRKKIKN